MASQSTVPAAATRTSRPRNRKAQIVSAAGDLFYRFGYHNVGTEDIAGSVGITAGALYRHFRGKQELLASTLVASFDEVLEMVRRGESGELEATLRALAEAVGARRDLGVLWNRESRHLDDELWSPLHARLRDFFRWLAGSLRAARPELSEADAQLLARCCFAVLTSPSYHRTAISIEPLVDLLHEMTWAVSSVDLPARPTQASPGRRDGGVAPGVRRQALLAAAAHLFSTRGYQAVRMEEVGAAVGVTSTSVYRHFATKADLAAAVVARGSQSLQLGLSRVLSTASSPEHALRGLVVAYIEFATAHHELLGVLVAEVMNLPQPHRHRIRREQHDYVAEWFRLLEATRPELDRLQVRFRVHAALTVINEVSRDETLREAPGMADVLRLVATRVLGG